MTFAIKSGMASGWICVHSWFNRIVPDWFPAKHRRDARATLLLDSPTSSHNYLGHAAARPKF